jgi:uncharacterized protein (DUF885 family)
MNRRDFIHGGLGVAAVSACSPEQSGAQDVFEGKLAALTSDLLQAQPEAGLFAAAPGAARDRLLDRSPRAADLRRAASLRRAAQWRGDDQKTLAASGQHNFEAIDHHLAISAHAAGFGFGRFDPVYGFSPYATDHVQSACLTLPRLLKAALAGRDINEASLHVRRLKGVAAAIDGEIESARADAQAGVIAPSFVLQRLRDSIAVTMSLRPTDSLYVTALRDHLIALKQWQAEAPSAAPPVATHIGEKLLHEAETIVGASIFPAYRRAFSAFGELQIRASNDPGVARLTSGKEYYSVCLAFHVGAGARAEDLHRFAVARVRVLTGQLDMMLRSQGLADGDAAQRLATLSVDPRFAFADALESRQQMLADVRQELSRTAPLLPRVLRKPPMGPMEIVEAATEEAPEYIRPSLDGKRSGALLLDVRYPPRTARFALPTLAHRQGLPGRHFAALAIAAGNLPVIRKIIPGAAARLGWASYAEQLADEMGVYGNAPYARLGYLQGLIATAASAVIDTGIHALGWTFEQAAEFFSRTVGVSRSAAEDVAAECAAMPGLGCAAEAGRQEIVRLRDEARAALAAKFDIRDFHAAVLGPGEAPLSAIDSSVAAWIAAAKA